MSNPQTCPICETPAAVLGSDGGSRKIICPRCGKFSIGWQTRPPREYFNPIQLANLSGWVREHQDFVLTARDMASLGALRTPSVGEKADKLLLFLSRAYPKPGQLISLKENSPQLSNKASLGRGLYGVCWCQDQEEFVYILYTFLRDEKKFIHADDLRLGADFTLTPSGWAHLDSLRRGGSGAQAFIAMWIDDSMNEARKAIDQGIQTAGYDALRIDQKQHNNEITDEIIAEIRKSKFLVADLTDHRNGVYFEAGFAKGLGLEVIWLCRRDELDKAHFDTRQYNFIVWEADKLPELSKALQSRIEATIGRGPLPVNALT